MDAERDQPWTVWRRRLCLLAIPILALALARIFQAAKGPFWLGSNLDPDYAYLLNGLALAEGQPPGHVDHPGTPVQSLCAVVIRTVASFSGHSDATARRLDVLARPEYYLAGCALLFQLVYALLMAIFGAIALRQTQSLLIACIGQGSFLLATQSILALNCVKPEPFLLVTGLLIAIAVQVYLGSAWQYKELLAGLVWGALIGVGCAAKITFAPVALLPLILLRGIVPRMLFLTVCAGGFYAATVPMHTRWDVMMNWFTALATHTGQYGNGAEGVIDVSAAVPALARLLARELPFTALLLAGIVLTVALFSSRERTPEQRTLLRALLALSVTDLFQLALVAKHPFGGERYLAPAFSLLGLNVYIALRILRTLPAPRAAASRRAAAAILICAAAVQGWRLSATASMLASDRNSRQGIASAARDFSENNTVAGYYPSSSPLYALQFGNRFASALFSETLHAGYPHALFYNNWWRSFTNFRGMASDTEIAERVRNGALLIQGAALTADFRESPNSSARLLPDGVELEPVVTTPVECIYRMKNWP